MSLSADSAAAICMQPSCGFMKAGFRRIHGPPGKER